MGSSLRRFSNARRELSASRKVSVIVNNTCQAPTPHANLYPWDIETIRAAAQRPVAISSPQSERLESLGLVRGVFDERFTHIYVATERGIEAVKCA